MDSFSSLNAKDNIKLLNTDIYLILKNKKENAYLLFHVESGEIRQEGDDGQIRFQSCVPEVLTCKQAWGDASLSAICRMWVTHTFFLQVMETYNPFILTFLMKI